MARKRDSATTRELILRAAEDVVIADGVARLTLEKAAARAGVSKGGVLYHFATRNDLVAAMVERLATRFQAGMDDVRAAHPHYSFARAYLEECLAAPAEGEPVPHEERVGSALIAAIAAEPALLAPLRAAFGGWQHQIEQSADPVAATIARLAADGLWLCELFGIDGLSPQLREQVAHRLRLLVDHAPREQS
ncbi:MAG: TetR family transcriptional regulator [Kineosporiaceae bacterium]|nr:TetR family transcriptional regulator [Kineosporiaceae bacterium]